MKQIKNTHYEGERPLFASHGLYLEEVTIHAGESALKECSDIEAVNCRFEGKYPFWHNDGFVVKNCLFTEGARAALWYSRYLKMKDTLVEAPKMFREMDGVELENVQLPNALETLWYCRNVELNNVKIDKGDYLFIHGEDIRISGRIPFIGICTSAWNNFIEVVLHIFQSKQVSPSQSFNSQFPGALRFSSRMIVPKLSATMFPVRGFFTL